MSAAADRAALRRRAEASIALASQRCASSAALVRRTRLGREAARARDDVRTSRPARRSGTGRAGRAFTVLGLLEGQAVEAYATSDGHLVCPEALRRRAEVIVGMGDTFGLDGAGPPMAAALDRDPLAAVLTCMRAMDQVTSVELYTGG